MPYDSVIEDAARANGLDPALLRTISKIESGGDPRNRTGSYKGLFQLSDDEFGKHGGGDIYDPVANSNAAARKLAAESAAFKSKYGRDPSGTDIYLLHQQGAGGYGAHLANPDAPAWENMQSTAEGRQKGDRWSKQAIWGNVPDDVKRLFPGGVETMTSKDFVSLWDRKVNSDSPMASAFAAEGNRNMNPIEAALAQARARQQAPGADQGADPGILSSLAQQYAPQLAPFVPGRDTLNNASTAFSFLRDDPSAIAGTAYANKDKEGDIHTAVSGDNVVSWRKSTGQVISTTPLPSNLKPKFSSKVGPNGEILITDENTGKTHQDGELGRKLDPSTLKTQQDLFEKSTALHNTSEQAKRFGELIDNGELSLRWVNKPIAAIQNALGLSDKQTQNYNDFQQFRSNSANAILQAAKGTQTEGDAQRAHDEFVNGIAAGDNATVKRSLEKLITINGKLIESRKTGLDVARKAYRDNEALNPYSEGYDKMTPFYAPKADAPAAPAAAAGTRPPLSSFNR